ncbi:MAG: ATP-binding protein [Armatimonadota bacterium]|nr:ATP-binding protein [bacterium]
MPNAVGSSPLFVKIESDCQRPCVRLCGKADQSNVARMVDVLEQMADEHRQCVSLDLRELESMDASALQGFAEGIGAFKDRHKMLRVEGMNAAVRDVLDSNNLTSLFCWNCTRDCSPETCGAVDCSWSIDVFTMNSVISSCREARERVGNMARAAGFAKDSINDIMLAVGEAVVNAVKYGTNANPDAAFTVSCISTSKQFCVSVSDNGPGFNPEEIPSFEDALFMEHGRGVHCMNAVMDEVSFHFGSGTTVRLVKQNNR